MKLLLDTHIWFWSVANSERLSAPSESWAQKAMSLAPLREAPVTHEIALATCSVALPHRDPADRLLVATALIHGLTLVTADCNVGRSKQVPVLF